MSRNSSLGSAHTGLWDCWWILETFLRNLGNGFLSAWKSHFPVLFLSLVDEASCSLLTHTKANAHVQTPQICIHLYLLHCLPAPAGLLVLLISSSNKLRLLDYSSLPTLFKMIRISPSPHSLSYYSLLFSLLSQIALALSSVFLFLSTLDSSRRLWMVSLSYLR